MDWKISHNPKFWLKVSIVILLLADLVYLNLELTFIQRSVSVVAHQNQEASYSKSSQLSYVSQESFQKDCLKLQEASQHVGETQCVEGKIDHLYVSQKGTVFLSFCPSYKTCPFQAVIFHSDAGKFTDLQKLKGRLIQITGLVKTYQGKAEIIIHEPRQIKTQ